MCSSVHRKLLTTSVASLLTELGFDSAENAALETLTEMVQSCKCVKHCKGISWNNFIRYFVMANSKQLCIVVNNCGQSRWVYYYNY